MTQGKEDYVDVKTVAQHLGVARSFVYKLITEKRIPYYKVGGAFRFKISEVDGKMESEMKYA